MFQHRTRTVVMSLHTMKEGLLFKRGRINTEWRQRLFILNRKQLAYFKGSVSLACDNVKVNLSVNALQDAPDS